MTADRFDRPRPRAHDGRSAAEQAIFAATEQLLAERPLHEVTVALILDRASLSRASFYHYFASKHHVVAGLLGRAGAALHGTGPEASVEEELRAAVGAWAARRDVVLAAVENRHAVPVLATAWAAAVDPLVVRIAARIEAERASGAAPAGPPAELVAATLVAGAERVFQVTARDLDPRIDDLDRAVEGVTVLAAAAVFGVGSVVAP